MKIRGTIIITFLAVIVILLYYFLEMKYFAKRQENPNNIVIKINPTDIKHFEITYFSNKNGSSKRAEKFAFKLDDGKWFIVKPRILLADRNEIEMILDKFNPLTYTKKIGKVSNLIQFGLNSPKTTVTLWQKGVRHPVKILFGNENPTGGSVYFSVVEKNSKVDGLEVYLTNSFIEEAIKKDLNTLRDKTILSFKEEEVKAFEIKFKPDVKTTSSDTTAKADVYTTYTFEKKGKRKWDLRTSPEKSKIKQKTKKNNEIKSIVENIILEVNDLKGNEVVDEHPEKLSEYGLDIPCIEIIFTLNKLKRVLLCGNKRDEDGYYVKVDNREEIFLVDTWKIDNIKKELEKLK